MLNFRKIINSRIVIIWSITLVVIVISLALTLVLISNSKKNKIVEAPPKVPNTDSSDIVPSSEQVNIFLFNLTTDDITPVTIELRLYPELTARLKQIITALIQKTLPNYRNPIPRGTTLNEIYIDSQKTAYLDFSHHLKEGHIGGTTAELITVTAILKTVFDAFPDDIKYVQILIDGAEVDTLAGHLNLLQPLRL